jgi:hypothetical protein
LLIGVGGSMGAAALSMLVDWRYGPTLSVAAGALLVGWIIAQVLIIVPDGGFSWLQPTMFAAGLLVAALGWRLGRGRSAAEGRSNVNHRCAAHT